MKIGRRFRKKGDNDGLTMTEMIVTFALLALFMVAATKVISYVVGIYYASSGNTHGLEVSNMISGKIVGMLEGADASMNPIIKSDGSDIDQITFVDQNGSTITISASGQANEEGLTQGMYINIHYGEVTEGPVAYSEVDWRFDKMAYMGYIVKKLKFENAGDEYEDNVIRMTLVVGSDRYGDFKTEKYIKCVKIEKFEFE